MFTYEEFQSRLKAKKLSSKEKSAILAYLGFVMSSNEYEEIKQRVREEADEDIESDLQFRLALLEYDDLSIKEKILNTKSDLYKLRTIQVIGSLLRTGVATASSFLSGSVTSLFAILGSSLNIGVITGALAGALIYHYRKEIKENLKYSAKSDTAKQQDAFDDEMVKQSLRYYEKFPQKKAEPPPKPKEEVSILPEDSRKLRLAKYVKRYADREGVDYRNLLAIAKIESQLGHKNFLVSSAGASGIFQIMGPAYADVINSLKYSDLTPDVISYIKDKYNISNEKGVMNKLKSLAPIIKDGKVVADPNKNERILLLKECSEFNTLAGVKYYKIVRQYLINRGIKNPTPQEIYMGYNVGAANAPDIIRAYREGKLNKKVRDVAKKKSLSFYEAQAEDLYGKGNFTIREVYESLNKKFDIDHAENKDIKALSNNIEYRAYEKIPDKKYAFNNSSSAFEAYKES